MTLFVSTYSLFLGGIQSFDLLTIILFLLPGLVSVKVGLKIADRADWLNRIDTVAYSFLISLASITTLYFLYSYHADNFLTYVQIESTFSHPKFALANYAMTLWICLAFGFVLGQADFGREYGFGTTDPWTSFFNGVRDDIEDGNDYAVVVHTNSGAKVTGAVATEGETAKNRDLRLKSPTRSYFNPEGNAVRTEDWEGYVYIHNQEISHVEFDRLDNAQANRDEQAISETLSVDITSSGGYRSYDYLKLGIKSLTESVNLFLFFINSKISRPDFSRESEDGGLAAELQELQDKQKSGDDLQDNTDGEQDPDTENQPE